MVSLSKIFPLYTISECLKLPQLVSTAEYVLDGSGQSCKGPALIQDKIYVHLHKSI